MRRKWCLDYKTLMLTEAVQKGEVFQKAKRLHPMEALVLSSVHPEKVGYVSHNENEWKSKVHSQFPGKWGATHLQDRMNISDSTYENDGIGITVVWEGDAVEVLLTSGIPHLHFNHFLHQSYVLCLQVHSYSTHH